MINYLIRHLTRYEYTEPVSLCQNLAHLRPRSTPFQQCQRTEIRIEPAPLNITELTDSFGNTRSSFSIEESHIKLVVSATHQVSLTGEPVPDRSPVWERVLNQLRKDRNPDYLSAYEFLFDSPHVQVDRQWEEYARPSFLPNRPILDAVLDLTARIHADFAYDPEATTVATPLAEVFLNRRGVCQDFAHFQIACLRSLGLPARYVSGYVATNPPPGQPRLVGADASHAWVSVFCGDIGWVSFDPTNNQIPTDRHVIIAWGRDYSDVPPLKGVILGGGAHEVQVSVDVEPY